MQPRQVGRIVDGRPSRPGHIAQAGQAPGLPGIDPERDGGAVDGQDVGDGLAGVALVSQQDGVRTVAEGGPGAIVGGGGQGDMLGFSQRGNSFQGPPSGNGRESVQPRGGFLFSHLVKRLNGISLYAPEFSDSRRKRLPGYGSCDPQKIKAPEGALI